MKVGEALQVYLTQGADPFFARVDASLAVSGQVDALLAQLKTYEPTTVSDASSLLNTYSSAFDALAVADVRPEPARRHPAAGPSRPR